MARYVLRYRGSAAPLSEVRSLLKSADVAIVEETPRMLLVEANESAIKSLSERLQDWVVAPETGVPIPDTRYRIKRPID